MNLIPETAHPKKKPLVETSITEDSVFEVEVAIDPDPLVNFYAIDKNGWRSFRTSQLIKFESIE